MFSPCDRDQMYIHGCLNWRPVYPVSQIVLLSSNKMAVPHITAGYSSLFVCISSFIHLISFVMMKAAASSPPHRLSSVYCEDIKEQTPDISILLLSFPQSFSLCLVEYCSANFTLLRMCLVFLLACLDHLSLLCMNLTVLKTVLSNVYISPL